MIDALVKTSNFIFLINSRRDSPDRGQIYLLKIASIYMYDNFTPIGSKMAILGVFLKIGPVQEVIKYSFKVRKSVKRRLIYLTFYRSEFLML